MGDTANEHNKPLGPPSLVDWGSFSGSPSDNVFLFTRAVHRFAFTYNRQRDNAWMADYAYGCLSDKALYWFEGLDRDIQQDWSKLKPAIIISFPWDTSVPETSRSRVKAIRPNGVLLGYVGPLTRETNNHKWVAKAEEALVLDILKSWDTQQAVARIRLAVPKESFPFIGLEEQPGYWDFRACNAGPEDKGRAQADSPNTGHAASSKIWTVKKLADSTEELQAEWTDDAGTRTPLQALTNSPPSVYLWMRTAQGANEESVKLILERF